MYDIRNVPYTYKGDTSGILGVTGDFCPACAEVILENEEGQRFYAPVREFNKQGNAAFVEPEFVLRVRNKLGAARGSGNFWRWGQCFFEI